MRCLCFIVPFLIWFHGNCCQRQDESLGVMARHNAVLESQVTVEEAKHDFYELLRLQIVFVSLAVSVVVSNQSFLLHLASL
jgi:hypothetical protein